LKIPESILNILADCRVDGTTLFLPEGQLDRKTYEAVNKCLTAIGGKWNRKAKGHVFDYEPAEALENLIFTGETEDMKKTFQFFPTPRPVAEMVCDMAEIDSTCTVLEPSCGKGDLADVIHERGPKSLIGIDINREMGRYLKDKPYATLVGDDFLKYIPGQVRPFDRIIMNPPFSKQQDIDHILHAYNLLNSGGVLVSVMSPSPFFRTNKKSVAFREWLDSCNGEIVDVPEGSFKESGTMIATKIIKVVKEV